MRYYYRNLSARQSNKSLWAKVKQLGIGRAKASASVPVELNAINDYFVNVPVDLSGARDYVTELGAAPRATRGCQFSFTPVTEADVLWAVMRTSSNAVGVDNIPIKFIKDTLPVTLPYITLIFNKSLSSHTFPSVWKSAMVLPLPKSSSPKSHSEFRPISILPALSKCLERLVHRQFSSFLFKNRILSNFQSGFRSSHSTTTALLKITEDIRESMDQRQATILTLFDFSKAFDCVFHPLLLIKLKECGFSEGCVDWIRSYLTDRQQCVKWGDGVSGWRPVTRGVPQGSVLGPLLFSLYIDDVTSHIRHSNYHLYADDLQIYRHFPITNFTDAVELVNLDIQAIVLWAHRHGLVLNESKTQSIVIGYNKLLTKLDLNSAPKLKLNDHELTYCDRVKNLGLIMNRHLTWNDQVTLTCNRVFASIHSLKPFVSFLPLNVRVMLVKTLVFPHFNYCDVVINDMTVELSDKLQRAQNYCIRFIFNLRRDVHITPFFKDLSILKLNELRKLHVIILLHSILTTKSPPYLSERFMFISEISVRDTRRGALLLSIPLHRTALYNKSFTVTSSRLWNSLPDNIKCIDKRARFGAEVKDLLRRGLWG